MELSDQDRKILKTLLIPDGISHMKDIAEKTGIPVSTVIRRRNRMEPILKMQYILDISSFGWRRIEFLIGVQNGKADEISNKLLAMKEITQVEKHIGQHMIDIAAGLVVKSSEQLLGLIEIVRAYPGVKDLMWSEIVKVYGRNISVPTDVIDELGR